jgi:hypothetical protein
MFTQHDWNNVASSEQSQELVDLVNSVEKNLFSQLLKKLD